MKKIIIAIFFCLSFCFAKSQNDTFRISVVGSSMVAQYGDIPLDSFWYRLYAYAMRDFTGRPVKVIQINHLGARTIGSIDPRKITGRTWSFTNYENDFGLVDSVLKPNPDLVIIAASSNEITNGMPVDTIIECFKSTVDTLKARGVKYIIVDNIARQRTFISPVTAQTYHDSTLKLLDWFEANHKRNIASVYFKLYDSVFGFRPKPEMLGPDSLHLSRLGKGEHTEALLECLLTDSLFADFAGIGRGFSLKKNGANIHLKIKFKGRRLVISGSNDYRNFTPVKTFFNTTSALTSYNESFADVGYLYYKVEAISGKRRDVVTRKLN